MQRVVGMNEEPRSHRDCLCDVSNDDLFSLAKWSNSHLEPSLSAVLLFKVSVN